MAGKGPHDVDGLFVVIKRRLGVEESTIELRLGRFFRVVGLLIGVGTLVFGLLTLPTTTHVRYKENVDWLLYIYLVLVSVPLLVQLIPSPGLRVSGACLGILMVLQAPLSRPSGRSDFKTLPPNMSLQMVIKDGYPGLGKEQYLSTDSKGFRSTKPIDYSPHDESTFRVFAVGGSSTEQIFIGDKRTWTHLLQAQLDAGTDKNVEVINAGVAGTRAKHHLATLDAILPYEPDLVLFTMGINDWNRHLRQRGKAFFSKNPQLRPKRPDSKPSGIRGLIHRIDIYYSFHKTILGVGLLGVHSWLQGEGMIATDALVIDGPYHNVKRAVQDDPKLTLQVDVMDDDYLAAVAKIMDRCQEHEVRCMFANQAIGYRRDAGQEYLDSLWLNPGGVSFSVDMPSMVQTSSVYNHGLMKLSKQRGFEFCAIAERMVGGHEYYYDDCHFNEAGAVRMSELLGECIRL